MAINILGKGKVNLFHNIKFIGLSRHEIISCKVRNSNLFAKVLDEKEIAVFGDFYIFICYKNEAKEGEHKYEIKSKREVFCEVIPYEKLAQKENSDSQEIKVAAFFAKGPECSHKLVTVSHSNSYLDIKVSGEIRITVGLNEIESDEKEKLIIKKTNNVELKEKDKLVEEEKKLITKKDNEENNAKEPIENEEKIYVEDDENSDLKVMQFEEGIYTIEELMEMDFEQLESITDN